MSLSSQLASSRLIQPGVCTSSTRPASPFEGQCIFETDTDKLLVWNGTAWVMPNKPAQNPDGLELIKTQTVGTAVSSQNVTSCFNSTYDDYIVMLDGISCSSNGSAFYFKLLSGTTPTTSGFYGNTFYIGIAAGGGLSNAAQVNASQGEMASQSGTYTNYGKLDIHAPFAASATRYNFINADNNYLRFGAGIQNSNTSFDGIQIIPGAGTLTGGTISVYGYRK